MGIWLMRAPCSFTRSASTTHSLIGIRTITNHCESGFWQLELWLRSRFAQGRIEETTSLFERAIVAGEELAAGFPGNKAGGAGGLAPEPSTFAGEGGRTRKSPSVDLGESTDTRQRFGAIPALTGFAIGGLIADIEHERVLAGSSSSPSFGSFGGQLAIDDRLRRLASREADSMSAEVWAGLVDQVMHSHTGFPMNSAQESDASFELIGILGALAAHQRNSGRIDVARATVERTCDNRQQTSCTASRPTRAYGTVSRFNAGRQKRLADPRPSCNRAKLETRPLRGRQAASLDPQDDRARSQ